MRLYFPHWSWPGGEDGAEDEAGEPGSPRVRRTRPGEVGGVLEPASDGGLARWWRCCLKVLWLSRGPGPELSDGVGGSPLLHAIEQ